MNITFDFPETFSVQYRKSWMQKYNFPSFHKHYIIVNLNVCIDFWLHRQWIFKRMRCRSLEGNKLDWKYWSCLDVITNFQFSATSCRCSTWNVKCNESSLRHSAMCWNGGFLQNFISKYSSHPNNQKQEFLDCFRPLIMWKSRLLTIFISMYLP